MYPLGTKDGLSTIEKATSPNKLTPAWSYFDDLGDNAVRCKLCGLRWTIKGLVPTMKIHLKVCHREAFDRLLDCMEKDPMEMLDDAEPDYPSRSSQTPAQSNSNTTVADLHQHSNEYCADLSTGKDSRDQLRSSAQTDAGDAYLQQYRCEEQAATNYMLGSKSHAQVQPQPNASFWKPGASGLLSMGTSVYESEQEKAQREARMGMELDFPTPTVVPKPSQTSTTASKRLLDEIIQSNAKIQRRADLGLGTEPLVASNSAAYQALPTCIPQADAHYREPPIQSIPPFMQVVGPPQPQRMPIAGPPGSYVFRPIDAQPICGCVDCMRIQQVRASFKSWPRCKCVSLLSQQGYASGSVVQGRPILGRSVPGSVLPFMPARPRFRPDSAPLHLQPRQAQLISARTPLTASQVTLTQAKSKLWSMSPLTSAPSQGQCLTAADFPPLTSAQASSVVQTGPLKTSAFRPLNHARAASLTQMQTQTSADLPPLTAAQAHAPTQNWPQFNLRAPPPVVMRLEINRERLNWRPQTLPSRQQLSYAQAAQVRQQSLPQLHHKRQASDSDEK